MPNHTKWYYIGIISSWGLILIFRILLIGYRGIAKANIEEIKGAFIVTLTVARLWNFKPGQYIYLRALDTANFTFLQSHPFCVVWWENNTEKNNTISLLVYQQRGLSKYLPFLNQRSMLLEGPYGNEQKFKKFNNIVFLATDIGVAAVLPYLKDLIVVHPNLSQKISFIWILSHEGISTILIIFYFISTIN